ncbi:hypothetical protein FACS189473_1000 [Spirochaetia bacterium]|nr:hypothetical protein FACS189473_1000 [Spirochaetia bacterium]
MQKKLFLMGMFSKAMILAAMVIAVLTFGVVVMGCEGPAGPAGPAGADGNDGISIIWKGTLAAAPANPVINWAYYNTADKKAYIYDGAAWQILAVDGDKGDTGNTGATGAKGDKGDIGDKGNTGDTGAAGVGIVWKGSLTTAPANPVTNWAYYNTDEKKAYIYDGTTWQILAVDGDKGDTGDKGDKGDTVVTAFNLTILVTAPVTSVAAQTIFAGNTQYTGTIAWKTATDADHTGAFAGLTVYKAVVTLTPKTGFSFNGVEAGSFTYTGATSVTNAANSGIVTITFPKTDSTERYVSSTGDDTGDGSPGAPLATVKKALELIYADYTASGGADWPLDGGNPKPATIIISGTINTPEGSAMDTTSTIIIGEASSPLVYPPIVLQGGTTPGTLRATGARRVLYINGNTVTVGANLTISGGNPSSTGGGVMVGTTGTFILNGGTISDNTATTTGGGVYVSGSGSTFTMNSGTISGNTATTNGGGVYVNTNGTFTMNNGTISDDNTATNGGGVYVNTSGSTFTMNSGTISGNTATGSGGGVLVNSGTFTMNDGTISGNNADRGGGVALSYGTFNMKGGTISGNTATGATTSRGGGGVYVAGQGSTFIKTGGTITDTNIVTSGSGKAVLAFADGVPTSTKKRETTAGTSVNLYAKYDTSATDLVLIDPASGGAGDTTANWTD